MNTRNFGVRSLTYRLSLLGLGLAAAVTGGTASAHRLGESYIFLSATETTLQGRFEVTFADLDKAVPLDTNRDGNVTTAEFELRAAEAGAYMQERLTLRLGDTSYRPVMTRTEVHQLDWADFAWFHFDLPDVSPVPDAIDVRYAFLFDDVEPGHRGLVVIENNTRTGIENSEINVVALFGPGDGWQTISFIPPPPLEALALFVWHGVWHIWIGLDHILFIVSLLLPSVLVREGDGWKPVDDFRKSMWYVIKVVTLFTIAHSITLSLSSLGIVRLPPNLVESIIAFSIAIAALNNIVPWYSDKIWLVVFGFGLFHGFGFASVLAPLGLAPSNLVQSLIGFNFGVELGQIAVICVVFPLLFWLRKSPLYQPLILKAGSVVLIIIAMVWFVQRAAYLVRRASQLGWI